MTSKHALSRRQFQKSGFDDSAYEFNYQPGEFTGTIDCKRWGKGKKLVTYMTFEDGRKIAVLTWPRSNYEGLAGMLEGSKVRITYMESRNGILCVRRAVLLAGPCESALTEMLRIKSW